MAFSFLLLISLYYPGAVVYSATDPRPSTHGCPWLLPDDGPLFLLEKEELREGVYKMLDDRLKRLTRSVISRTLFYHHNADNGYDPQNGR
jgi:hypothetical protein